MRHFHFSGAYVALLAGTAIGLAGSPAAHAGLLNLSNVLAYKGGQIPGQAPGVIWGALNTPSVAKNGRVVFSGSISGVAAANSLGIFSGTTSADVTLLVQSGTQAPGGPAGATMDLNGSSSGFNAETARINAAGVISFVSLFTGGGSTANVNNQAIFTGTAGGGFGMFVRRGDAAPGTAGAVLNTSFLTSNPINASGTGFFAAALTGGDVSGTTNNNGIFGGIAGNLSLIARRGGAAAGVAGGTFGTLGNPVPNMANANGQLVFGNTLNSTGGVTSANDSVLYMYTPGSGLSLLAREGNPAPGTSGATYTGSFTMNTANFNNAGQAAYGATLAGGDVVGTTNNAAFYIATTGGSTLAWRNGTAASGTDATFLSASAFNLGIDNAGRIVLSAALTGGTTTTANDSGIWYGAPGLLELIAREGSAVPTLNATFSSLSAVPARINALGQLVFISSMLSGDAALNNKQGVFAYDPILGLMPLAYAGMQLEVSTGVFKTVAGIQTLNASNSDGSSFALSDTGWLTLKLTTADSTDIIVSYAVPAPGSLALLGLGGALLVRRRR
ncbi:MAG: choice-of-anchor tandem repeat NxxGxxAF-containing protein [Planctomycetota bacterium]